MKNAEIPVQAKLERGNQCLMPGEAFHQTC